MNAEQLTSGRWFRVTLEHGEDLKGSLLEWAREHDVRRAWVQCLGEVADLRVASGYEDEDPGGPKLFEDVESNHHVQGVGTVVCDEDREQVHLHGPLGRAGETTTGCWADRPTAFRGMELLVMELQPAEST